MVWLDEIQKWITGENKNLSKRVIQAVRTGKFVSTLPFPVLICNSKFFIIGSNIAFAQLFKITRSQLEEKNLRIIIGDKINLLDTQNNKEIPMNLTDLFKNRNPKTLIGKIPRIGEKVFHLYTKSLLINGKREHFLIFQDITKLKKLEENIIKSRFELLSVFDGIEDPMVMIDQNFKIHRINETMLKTMGGRSYFEYIGQTCYKKLHGLKDKCTFCPVDKVLSTGEKTSQIGVLKNRPDFEAITYQISCYPLKDDKGHLTGVAECYRDLAEVTKIQEEIYESERVRIMKPLAAGLAHEVRNPLAVITSTAQYCMEEVGSNKDLQESLETIVNSAKTANRVVSDLLDFARPQKVNFERQSLKAILEEGIGLIKGRARKQKVRLSINIPQNLPKIVVDRGRFLQAYMNFLMNSLDEMLKGGKLTVEVTTNRRDQKIELIIRDTGKGISEEMVNRAFQPFYSTKKDGVGLGLPIAEGIIRSHGGRVTFKGLEEKGAEVCIDLPLKEKELGEIKR